MKPGEPATNAAGVGRSGLGVSGTTQQPADGARAVLQRDLGHFLVDLSIALHRFAMYPPGHPSLAPALETLAGRADALLQDRPRFAVGVARDRLVIEGIVTDERHPLLRSLAERLHRHHLSALSFCRGVSVDELAAVLHAIAEDPDRGGSCLGTRPAGEGCAWPHVWLHPLSVHGLEIIGDQGAESRPTARAAELWIGLAQAALGTGPESHGPAEQAEPAAVARAIDDHQRVEAYDQVIVGYMLQIADEVRDARDPDTIELRHRVSTLVSSLQPETLRKLLTMGGHVRQRDRFLRTAAAGMRAGAVVSLVKAAAEAGGGAVSSGLLRVLGKLAAHAEAGPPVVQPLADSALREQVERLSTQWSLADPNPAEYSASLEQIAQETIQPVVEASSNSRSLAEPLRLLEMCVELQEGGPPLVRTVEGVVDVGQAREALLMLGAIGRDGPAREAWEYLVWAATVARLLAAAPPDLATLDALLPHLRGPALAPLLDALVDSEDRHLRRAVYDRLRSAGAEAASQALARLHDTRWYVTRNLLSLLAEVGALPPGTDPSEWLAHEDARVRREAMRVALRIEGLRDRAIWNGLADTDERVIIVAVNGALEHPRAACRPRLVELIAREGLDDDVRAQAIEALGRVCPAPDALEVLLRVASSHGRLLVRAAPATRSARAALAVLAAHWADDPRALPLLRHAVLPGGLRPAEGARS